MICPIFNAAWIASTHATLVQLSHCAEKNCGWWDGEKEQCAILTLAHKPMKARINDINMEIEAATVTMEMPYSKKEIPDA